MQKMILMKSTIEDDNFILNTSRYMSVDMKLLKELRGLTHAPLKDCKNALLESWNDLAAAQDRLREKGALKAAKNADRETNEWIVMIREIDGRIVWLKLASETDFVAKNEKFRALAEQILAIVSTYGDVSTYGSLSQDQQDALNKVLQDNFVTIGENMRILDVFSTDKSWYVYTHPWDRVAAVVYYDGDESVAKNVALQVAAMSPTCLSVDDVSQEEKDAMSEVFMEEMKDSGKPEEILKNIIVGKMNKKYSEFVLLEQVSIFDDSKKIKDTLGDTVVNGYVRYAI